MKVRVTHSSDITHATFPPVSYVSSNNIMAARENDCELFLDSSENGSFHCREGFKAIVNETIWFERVLPGLLLARHFADLGGTLQDGLLLG